MKDYPSFEDVQKARQHLRNVAQEHWIHDDLFTWKWWFLLVLSFIPWYFWWKFADKKRLTEILLYGMLIALFCIILDNIGTDELWWDYPDKLYRMFPPLIPADISLVPCLMMVVYQISASWKDFLVKNFILSLLMAYLGENLFILLNFYELNSWKLFYSVIFYNVSGFISRWIVLKTKNYH